MKNKIKLIFLTLVFFISISISALTDEFNFDITELQVTEGGNIIRGINGGVVTTKDNQIKITADNFKYNKLTKLLEAQGNVIVFDKIADVIIESNKVFYFKNKEEIYTTGKSKALNGNDFQIDAEQYFRYNKLTSLLEAKGNVKLEDKIKNITTYTNEIFYLLDEEKISTLGKTNVNIKDEYNIDGSDLTLLRNEMILSSDKKATISDNVSNIYSLEQFQYSINQEILKGKNIHFTRNEKKNKIDKYFFKTGFFNLKEDKFLGKDITSELHKTLFDDKENDPRFNAVSGYGDEFNTYYDKGIFTSCKKTDKCPPWKMRATNIRHDKVKKQVIYKNAWLELYDYPVMYFPKFFHPGPSVKRQSGIIGPEIGDHTTLGDSIYLPYFLVISDDKDMTLKPRLFNNGTILLQNEYRQITKNSLTLIDASITKSHDSNKINDRDDNRSHFFANSKIDLDMENFLQSNLEINYEKTTNDTYLKVFDFMRSPLNPPGKDIGSLESFIELDLIHENYDLTTSFEMYESLGGLNSDKFQYVYPSYGLTKIFDLEELNGTFNFNSSGSNTLGQTNVTTSVLNNDLSFTSYDSFFYNGIITNFEVLLKNINSVGKNSTTYKNSPQSELISAYIYDLSFPLLKNTKNSINRLTPKLSLRFSPHDMKNNSGIGRRINVDNAFSSNRLALGNSYETGESLTIGIDFMKEKMNVETIEEEELNSIEKYFDFKLATVLKLNEEKNIPSNSTLNKKRSNVFGQVNFNPNKITSVKYNFSMTDNLGRFEYNSLELGLEFDNFSTSFSYLEESGILGNTNVIGSSSKYNFDEFNTLSFATRRNRELNLTEYYDLVYEYKNDCLIANIKYRKDYYNSNDLKPKEEMFFSITIVPFYTYSPDKMILNKDRVD